MRFVTGNIPTHNTIDQWSYSFYFTVIWIKNRLQAGDRNMIFGLLRMILNELVWKLLFNYDICPLLYTSDTTDENKQVV